MSATGVGPQAWTAQQVRDTSSWVLHLQPQHHVALDKALEYATRHQKPLLQWQQEDFPLDPSMRTLLAQAIATTQGRWGMCLIKGFPVDRWSEHQTRLAYWGMGLYMGVVRPQNRNSDVMTDVRDAGGSYKVKGGRGYNTNAELDFHIDSADVVSLLCRRTARAGGQSKVVSSLAIRDEVARIRPDLLIVMQQPFLHSYQGAQDPRQPPYYGCPIFAEQNGVFAARSNRKNIVAVERDFEQAPRLTPQQIEALDLLDELMRSEDFCYDMQLEPGDMQLLNSYVTLHSRTAFEDFEEPDRKRHLIRLWLAITSSQPLPDSWEEYFIDVRPGVVRGGMRGQGITPEFAAYESRQAKVLGMQHMNWDQAMSRLFPKRE